MAANLNQQVSLIIQKGPLKLKSYIRPRKYLKSQGWKLIQEGYTAQLDELPPPLLRLSIETIQYIATLLPPSYASAPALSPRRVKEIIGTGYWEQCKLCWYEEQTQILLELLSRDSLDEINCHRCLRLHAVGPQHTGRRKCALSDLKNNASRVYFDGFEFMYLQIAMKLRRQRGDPSPIYVF